MADNTKVELEQLQLARQRIEIATIWWTRLTEDERNHHAMIHYFQRPLMQAEMIWCHKHSNISGHLARE